VTVDDFREVVLVDSEFVSSSGERPVPLCLAAHEIRSGRCFRVWRDEFGSAPPYATGSDVLFVAFYASAELGCYRSLDWRTPERILDLFVEFRNHTNGLPTPAGASLFGALTFFGLDAAGTNDKSEMQEAIGSGQWEGRFTPEEILSYCQNDTRALARLLAVMAPLIDLPRALLRGRYMAACAAMERAGTPVDTETLGRLRDGWTAIQDRLISAIDHDYGVYDGRTFKADRFESYLTRAGIPWERTETGRLSLDDDVFRHAAKAHPQIAPLRELRSALSDMRLNDLAIGSDGRNRTILSAFRSRTGRNQPSNTRYIFGPSVWLRGLIKPPSGCAVAYIDWAQQEFGAGAALSGDPAMQAAYRSGDPYLAFGKQASAIPSNATKATHGPQRRAIQARRFGGAIWHGGRRLGAAHRPTADRCSRSFARASRDLSHVLALVRRRRRLRHVDRFVENGFRLAPSCRGELQPPFHPKLPNASKWQRNDALSGLSGDRARG
jgi:DNA polymerase-1